MAVATDQGGDGGPLAALGSATAHLRFWGVALLALVIDLATKDRAFRTLAVDEIRPMLGGWIELRRSLNAGAVFGSFSGQTWVFIAASVLALGFVVYLFAHSQRRQRSLHVALALILSGALGNLYDRAFVVADVVDHRTASGRVTTLIGRIVSDPGAAVVVVEDWPGGSGSRRFPRSQITARRQGVVRDFIKLVPRFPSWVPRWAGRDVWPWIFNVADVALVLGVIVLLGHTWLGRHTASSRP